MDCEPSGADELIPRGRVSALVGANKKLIEEIMSTTDRTKLGQFLSDDVEWVEWADGVPPSGAVTRGKAAFLQNYGDDTLRSEVHRVTEENNVVVVEGVAHVTKKDGRTLRVQFCDIFELENRKIKRKSSYGALIQGAP